MSDYIKTNLKEILDSIAEISEKYSRIPGTVKLVAVSKTKPSEAVQEAYDAGQLLFGENRVQELTQKVHVLPDDIEWHMIGHLQGNKVAKAVELSHMIHSVDSEKLLRRIDRIAVEAGKKQKILLELNVSGEASKFGENSDSSLQLASVASQLTNIDFQGLMTMAPFAADECELRKIFSNLRELRDNMEKEFDLSLPELSMGMSSDYEAAIAEGATLVRIGTAIFGKRY